MKTIKLKVLSDTSFDIKQKINATEFDDSLAIHLPNSSDIALLTKEQAMEFFGLIPRPEVLDEIKSETQRLINLGYKYPEAYDKAVCKLGSKL